MYFIVLRDFFFFLRYIARVQCGLRANVFDKTVIYRFENIQIGYRINVTSSRYRENFFV